MVDDIPNQNNYQDDQNFDIDINKVYTDFITEIDANRSFVSLEAIDHQLILAKAKTTEVDITSITGLVKMETTAQESRCHTFFRLIGFPVISDDKRIYNPGFDIIFDATRKITQKEKIDIALSPIDGFENISRDRENRPNTYTTIFSSPQSIDAGVLALSSGGTQKLRKFTASLPSSADPFDMSPIESYSVDVNALVGDHEIELTKFEDSSGNKPTKFSNIRKHIISPFIVDGRIDFGVAPHSHLVAVPFVPDQSKTKVSATEFVKRPLLEKIIRDRFSVEDATTAGTATTNMLDFINASGIIKDQNLINLVSGKDIYKLSELAQFAQTINIIKTMMSDLVNAKDIINKAQGDYYWVPAPSTSGPEGGSDVQGVFLPALNSSGTLTNKDLITKKDAAIIIASAKNIANTQNSQAGALSTTPDPGSFALSSYTLTFGPDTTSGLGDNSGKNLDTLAQARRVALTEANDALKTIEIIMGEFSGFGLCDIIAIMGALNIMPKNKLFGFLDTDAFNRAVIALNIQEPELTELAQVSIDDAMISFTSIVKDFYNLMDKIYQNIQENNGNS